MASPSSSSRPGRTSRGAAAPGRPSVGSAFSRLRRGPKGTARGGPTKPPRPDRATRKARRRERLQQIRTAWTTTRQLDPKLPLWVFGTGLLVLLVVLGLGLLLGAGWLAVVPALLIGGLAGFAVFGRRAQQGMFTQIEGQKGAAYGVLTTMRGDWRVQAAVVANKHQDMVHRVLGRPGVVLVAEGSPGRTRGLVVQERRRVQRVLGDFPVYDLHIGDEEGQVPLRRLSRHLTTLPRNVKGAQVNAAEKRLAALGSGPPLPKGPLPTGGRTPRPPRGMR